MLQNAISGWVETASVSQMQLGVLAAAVLATLGLSLWMLVRSRAFVVVGPDVADVSAPTFLFEGRNLVDATPSARRMIRRSTVSGDDWDRVVAALNSRFPALSDLEGGAVRPGEMLGNGDDTARLEVDCWDDMVRLSVVSDPFGTNEVHPVTIAAMEDEIETLRTISNNAPALMWTENRSGQVTWANTAYVELADQIAPGPDAQPSWPPPRIFAQLPLPLDDSTDSAARVPLEVEGSSRTHWYDVTCRQRDNGSVNFASDVSAIVTAEDHRREFMQTITKTFAQLSIGLAIFDRKRRLVIFNPALLDLTSLPVAFLSGHPHIRAFLDRLRDHNMIPEPTNYRTWREHMAALEVAAERGSYRETWTLPNGQTYRVTGRPHPDGAIAFTFEDVSAEISLTRNFRAELDIAQGVLDTLEEAIAVFSPAGTMWMSNAAYAALWKDSAEGLNEIRLSDQIELWRQTTAPSEIWPSVQAYGGASNDRTPIQHNLRCLDGRLLKCRFEHLPGGAFLAGFQPIPPSGGGTKLADVAANDVTDAQTAEIARHA